MGLRGCGSYLGRSMPHLKLAIEEHPGGPRRPRLEEAKRVRKVRGQPGRPDVEGEDSAIVAEDIADVVADPVVGDLTVRPDRESVYVLRLQVRPVVIPPPLRENKLPLRRGAGSCRKGPCRHICLRRASRPRHSHSGIRPLPRSSRQLSAEAPSGTGTPPSTATYIRRLFASPQGGVVGW